MSDEKTRKAAYRFIANILRDEDCKFARRLPAEVSAEVERICAVMEAAAALPSVDGSNGVTP